MTRRRQSVSGSPFAAKKIFCWTALVFLIMYQMLLFNRALVSDEILECIVQKSKSDSESASSHAGDNLPWPGHSFDGFFEVSPTTGDYDTLVLIIVSCSYLDMADNLLGSMFNVGVRKIAVVPMDVTASQVLRTVYEDRSTLRVLDIPPFAQTLVKGHSNAATYGSLDFNRLTSTRPIIIKSVLENLRTILGTKGDDDVAIPKVFYADIDTYFKHKDLLPFFRNSSDLSFVPLHGPKPLDKPPSNNGAVFDVVGAMDGVPNNVCSCMLYLRGTSRTLQLLNEWTKQISSDIVEDQVGLNEALNVSSNVSVRVLHQESPYTPSGKDYDVMNDTSKVLIAHNNWMVGHESKMRRFKEKWGLWHPTGRLARIEYQCGMPGVRKIA